MSDNKKPADPWLYKVSLWLGSAALAIAGIVLIIWKTLDDAIIIVILLGALTLASNFFIYMGMDKPLKDERARKIGTLAATYSWFITIVFMCFLLVTGYGSGRVFAPEELFWGFDTGHGGHDAGY
jgi:NADH:ubiquinone oxidoreductase subunit 6 (subunit J)